MDSDLVVGIFMIIVWFVSSLIARFGKSRKAEAPPPPPPPTDSAPPPEVPTLQQALRDLAQQMGVEVQPAEPPVASEHTLTGSEHRQAEIETHQTLSEQIVAASEHRRTASETMRTASEAIFEAPEHVWTPSEHRRGDAVAPQRNRLPPPGRAHRRGRSKLAKRVQADLTGSGSLARAIVLREILGPPVALRPPDQDPV